MSVLRVFEIICVIFYLSFCHFSCERLSETLRILAWMCYFELYMHFSFRKKEPHIRAQYIRMSNSNLDVVYEIGGVPFWERDQNRNLMSCETLCILTVASFCSLIYTIHQWGYIKIKVASVKYWKKSENNNTKWENIRIWDVRSLRCSKRGMPMRFCEIPNHCSISNFLQMCLFYFAGGKQPFQGMRAWSKRSMQDPTLSTGCLNETWMFESCVWMLLCDYACY